MPIPQDLRDFLSKPENRTLTLTEGEIRQIELYSPDELHLQKFEVDGNELFLNGPLTSDPGETREYEGYPLVKRCNDYSPHGVLVWFPPFNAFGTADCGHGRILLYPGVAWSQICRSQLGITTANGIRSEWLIKKLTLGIESRGGGFGETRAANQAAANPTAASNLDLIIIGRRSGFLQPMWTTWWIMCQQFPITRHCAGVSAWSEILVQERRT